MTACRVCLVLSVLWLATTEAAVDEELLKEAARDFYIQKLHATSEVLENISASRVSFPRILGLKMNQGRLTGIADKSIDKNEIYKRNGHYVVVFNVRINHLGCSYEVYQHRPHRGVSACSGKWGLDNIKNDVQVTLALEHHRWTPDYSECRVSLERVQVTLDFLDLDKGSQCPCCNTYDNSVKKSLQEKLNDVVGDYFHFYYNHSHKWGGTDIIKVNCMVEMGRD